MRRRFFSTIGAVFSCSLFFINSVQSQIDPNSLGYYEDALRYSQIGIVGTSRFQGLGGAGSTLGADISSVYLNPAGLGLYRKSELSITPLLGFTSTNTEFLGENQRDSRSYFGIPNLGVVFSNSKDDLEEGVFRGGSFGISFNKVANFQNQYSYSGINNSNSIIDFYAESAGGVHPDEYFDTPSNEINSYGALAYKAFLIEPLTMDDPSTPEQDTILVQGLPYGNMWAMDKVKQEEIVTTFGGQYQWNFSYGANFSDKFFLGGSLGIAKINFRRERTYRENVLEPTFNDGLQSLIVNDYYSARGTGLNVKLGFIYKPVDAIRFGASFQSPTWFGNIKESFNTDLNRSIENISLSQPLEMLPGSFNYKLITPYRFSPGVSIIVGKKGFITGDVEYVAYSDAILSSSGSTLYFSGDNRTIQRLYKNTLNYKVGAEFREDIYRFRAGLAYFSDPYAQKSNIDRSTLSISGGFGVRLSDYYFDLALVHSKLNNQYRPYVLSNGSEPVANIKNNLTTFSFTFGTFF